MSNLRAALVLLGASGLLQACAQTVAVSPPGDRTAVSPPTTLPGAALSTPAATAPRRAGLSAELLAAIDDLGSDDTDDHRQALEALSRNTEEIAGQRTKLSELATRLQQGTGRMLTTMTQAADAESHSRVVEALGVNEALSRFVAELAASDEEAAPGSASGPSRSPLPVVSRQLRERMLRYALSREGLPMVAMVYARDPATRARAVSQLAAQATPEADFLLARLVLDEDREPSLTALDACYDRKPTPAVVEALWLKAFAWAADPRASPGSTSGVARTVRVGRRDVIINTPGGPGARSADMEIATDVLVRYDSPLVSAKLGSIFAPQGTAVAPSLWPRFFLNEYVATSNLNRLLAAYKPREAIGPLLRYVNTSGSGYTSSEWIAPNVVLRFSNRIDALATLVMLTGQDAGDYGLTRGNNYNGRWGSNAPDDDQKIVKKLNTWWEQHFAEYGYAAPGADRPAK